MRIGVLAGTGFAGLGDGFPLRIDTPYGAAACELVEREGVEWLSLHRHAPGHRLPPHRIPHRANVDALARAGCDRVVALHVVGSLDPAVPGGTYFVPDDWMDVAGRPESTFFEDADVHVDMTEAFCPEVRAALLDAAASRGLLVRDGGVLTATQGPRFETRAEVRALAKLGATVVSMTAVPEAPLARERGLCYASLCLVTNLATGLGPRVEAERIVETARAMQKEAAEVLLAAGRRLPAARSCRCADAGRGARIGSGGPAG